MKKKAIELYNIRVGKFFEVRYDRVDQVGTQAKLSICTKISHHNSAESIPCKNGLYFRYISD